MKTLTISLLGLTLLATSGLACRHHSEGPVDKAKDVVHDIKEAGHDVKHDIVK